MALAQSIRTSGYNNKTGFKDKQCSSKQGTCPMQKFKRANSLVFWYAGVLTVLQVFIHGSVANPIVPEDTQAVSNGIPTLKSTTATNPFGSVQSPKQSIPSSEHVGKIYGNDVLRIDGIRVESSSGAEYGDDGIPSILSGREVILRLFGSGFTNDTYIAFTTQPSIYGGPCMMALTEPFRITAGTIHGRTVLVKAKMPDGEHELYFCAKNDENLEVQDAILAKPLIHQGAEPWIKVNTHNPILPIWLSICIIVTCLMFSSLFSGLNLGLMSLDKTELKILSNTGNEMERRYAAVISPIREHGNYLLCSILLGNVLVNSMYTIILDGLTSGLFAVIFSTISIVIFGEITPQAICSRHGLMVGAKTAPVTKMIMALTFPLSYPIAKILDYILGEEIGNVYNRERLKELIKVQTGDLDKDEVNIISGALELRKKTVGEVMTHIEDAFMLSLDAILNFETVSEIMKSGFSRIPVYDETRTNIVTLLYIKDLAFVDPDDNTPLKTLCEFYQNPCHFVFEDVTLDIMFKQFKEGHKGHMAFVHRVNNEGDGDPFYETVGLLTLEDVIEELIQAEIMDETDVFTDNRKKVRRQRARKQDFTVFAERRDNQRIRISPQLTLATFQYLSTTVEAFKPDVVSETILRRLLNQDIVHHIKIKGKDKQDPSLLIYTQSKPVDFFVLILEGRVEVTVGRENLMFESGPFTFFGTQALVQNIGIVESPINLQGPMGSLQSLNVDAMLRHTFIPDYSVRAVTEVVYLAIKRNLYLAAKRASLLERAQKVGEPNTDAFDDEVEKLLHSLDEDDRSIAAHTKDLNSMTPRSHSKGASHTPSPEQKPNGPSTMNPNSMLSPTNCDPNAISDLTTTAALLGRERSDSGERRDSTEQLNPSNTVHDDEDDPAMEFILSPHSKS